MNHQIAKKVFDLITITNKEIHPIIIKDIDDSINKVLQLHRDYVETTSDFASSYYIITKTTKPSEEIDKQITQYLDKIKHDIIKKKSSTVAEYVDELTNFHDKLVEFQSILLPFPSVDWFTDS